VLASSAFLISLPLGRMGAFAFSSAVADMLNLRLTDARAPWWVLAVQATAGLVVPLAFASGPIWRAARISVRSALDQHGATAGALAWLPAWLPVPARNVLRRPRRFALTITLLAAGGAMFMTALGVSRAWERNIDRIYETRHYDVEIRAHQPLTAPVVTRLASLPEVRTLEVWGYGPAAFGREGHFDVARTYPDRGHGSLAVLAPPVDTRVIDFPLVAGRWLRAADAREVVLNHVAAAQLGGPRPGAELTLSMDGMTTRWTLIGIVEEVGSPGVAYVAGSSFARASGRDDRRMVRIATTTTTASARADFIRRLERELVATGVQVETVIPFSELRTAVGDHVVILVRSLVAMAVVMALVGLLGLGSAIGVSVLERTREIAVMKAVGASRSRVLRLIVTEALITSSVSAVLAACMSLPLTWLVESLIGRLGFLAPLPFVVSPPAMMGWVAFVLGAGVLAAFLPARRAASMTIHAALAEI
jgi:putative ABC transport system permease protein